MKHEILEIRKIVDNESLPMPIIQMIFDSFRHQNSNLPFTEMRFSAYFNDKLVPDWAYVNGSFLSDVLREDYIIVNVVDANNYDDVKKQSKWPLRTNYSTGAKKFGYLIEGSFDASSYTELQENGDEDTLMAMIISFDVEPTDSVNTKGVPEYFQLRPCDELSISINLKYYKLIDRQESPCRNDYPPELKRIVKDPLEPFDLYNSILAPALPYDPVICEKLCYVNYWLPKCDCIMSYDIWKYAGSPINMTQCQFKIDSSINDACVKDDVLTNTPSDEFVKCGCWKRCEGYEIGVTGNDKVSYDFGEKRKLLMKFNFIIRLFCGFQETFIVPTEKTVKYVKCQRFAQNYNMYS